MVEGAKRQKTPNEIALEHPAGRADDHLPARHAPRCCRSRSTASRRPGQGTPITVTVLVALLVCLIPTTIGGLLSAIGIAGMDRMIQANVIAMSGRAVEAAGDVDVLLLDKTGTITLGNRQATAFIPADGVTERELWPTRRSSPRWPTRRPRAAASSCWPRRSTASASATSQQLGATFVPFTAQTRMSGVEPRTAGRSARARPTRSRPTCKSSGGHFPDEVRAERRRRSPRRGGTPLVVADGRKRAGRHPAQGHRQGRHQGALRRAAPDGHQDRDDHRRQPADRRRHRRRGGRRRLPGPGHAGGQAQADPRRTRPAGAWWR